MIENDYICPGPTVVLILLLVQRATDKRIWVLGVTVEEKPYEGRDGSTDKRLVEDRIGPTIESSMEY